MISIEPGPASHLCMLGFGEAAQAFLEGMGARRPELVRAFDVKTTSPDAAVRSAKSAEFAGCGLAAASDASAAVENARIIISVVTASQTVVAARSAAAAIAPGAIYFDCNSAAPATKRSAAEVVERAGGRYIDVAVMAPVRPGLTAVPLLLSGAEASAGANELQQLSFSNVRALDAPVGGASGVKMIRSVMVKGLEALTAECLLAAAKAGVADEVLASLDASETRNLWALRADYNLDRMLVHGTRRAEEMREVVQTLEDLGVAPRMSSGALAWQDEIGNLGARPPPDGFEAKLTLMGGAAP